MTTRYERIIVPTLHPKQEEIYKKILAGQQFTVLAAGRRFGKSMLALALAMELAVNQGKRVWWVSPTYKQAGKQWRTARRMLAGIYTDKYEMDKRMNFDYANPVTGEAMNGELTFLSSTNVDNLRGDSLDFVILDEAAFQDPEVWRVLRPALTDRAGGALFISTPKGLNWFYKLFVLGKSGSNARWWSKQYTSYDNPYIPKSEIDDAKQSMVEWEFNTEHLAIFGESDTKVFRNVYEAAVLKPKDRAEAGRQYIFGVDIARRKDFTVVTVFDRESGEQVACYRWTNTPFPLQKKRMMNLYWRWRPVQVWIEENNAGLPVIEDLQAAGMQGIKTVFTSRFTKSPMIEALALAFEKGTIRILNTESSEGNAQYDELISYEVETTMGGNWVYGAPRGQHDDTVMAMALAWNGMTGKVARMVSSENSFYKEAQQAQKPLARKTLIDRYRKVRTIPMEYQDREGIV